MKLVGIIVNLAAAVAAGIIIARCVDVTNFPGGCAWNIQERGVIIALLLPVISLLFTIAYCGGGKTKK
ncbi:MAG: hypothetical protein MR051_03260 [Lentisphaeria bacterium]|nr:hypothetical protein [Lentisphaeria bacterium]